MPDLFMQGVAAMRTGRLDEAEAAYRRLLKEQPRHVGALNLLAQLCFKRHELDQAATLLQQARAADPQEPDTHYNLGLVLAAQGRRAEAIEAYRKAVRLRPGHANALANLAATLLESGNPAEAAETAERGLKVQPGHILLRHNHGMALWHLGRADEAIAQLRAASESAPDFVLAHNNLGTCLNARRQFDDAMVAYRRALAADPDNRIARDGLAEAMHRSLPAWHLPMLADRQRNVLYRRAIEAAVKPGMLVLDIGTGTGLLAMMAARAGAGAVVACEMDPRLAGLAREIVARNGFADRITVVARKSTDLLVGRDLPRRADLVVSEILDSGLVGEGMTSSMRHALAELVSADAIVIPAGAVMRGALIALPDLREVNPVHMIEGLDLSLFDRYRNRSTGVPLELAAERHEFLGPAEDLFSFDFTQPIALSRERVVSFRPSAAGTAHALAVWFELTLHRSIRGSTGPAGDFKHWKPSAYFFEADLALDPSRDVQLRIGHDSGGWWVKPA